MKISRVVWVSCYAYHGSIVFDGIQEFFTYFLLFLFTAHPVCVFYMVVHFLVLVISFQLHTFVDEIKIRAQVNHL
jgi:hypothetical protein